MTLRTVFLTVIMLVLGSGNVAHAATGLTFHGRILQSNGTPVQSANVFFKIQIRSPGAEDCLLYDEQQTLNMSGSNGIFVLTIGQGTRSAAAVDGGNSFEKIFANRGTLTGAPTLTCAFGTTYSPNMADGRKLAIQFSDNGGAWQALPSQSVNYSPLSIEAIQVGGYGKDQLLRVADGVTATEFTAGNWTALWDLITGNSNLYLKSDGSNFAPAGSVDYNGQKIVDLADPTAAQDGATKNYVDTRIGGRTVDMAGISNVAGDGKVLSWNMTLQKWEGVLPTDASKLPLAGGTMSGEIAMGTFKITGMGDPIAAQDASTKSYSDSNLRGQALATPIGQAGKSIRWNAGNTAWEYFTPFTAADLTNANVVSALGYTPVSRAGDTMTGLLILSGDPSNAVGAATKQYVDAVSTASSAAYVRIDGTTALTANWDLNGLTVGGTRSIVGLADPTVADGAATKGYVDAAITAVGTAANTYADGVAATAESDANTYTDGEIAALDASLQTYADGVAATAESNAKTYADGKLVTKALAVPAVGQDQQSIKWDQTAGTWVYYTPSSSDATKLPLAGGTMSGAIAMGTSKITGMGDPTAAQDAATKAYSDANILGKPLAVPAAGQVGQSIRWNAGNTAWEYYTPSSSDATKLPLAGGTMSGAIAMGNNAITGVAAPSAGGDVANKTYVDAGDLKLITKNLAQPVAGDDLKVIRWNQTAGNFEYATDSTTDSSKLPLAGGTMSGVIAMGNNKISGLAAPTAAGDAVDKTYADARETAAKAYADTVSGTAETNAKTYADGKLVTKALAVPAVGQDQQSIKWDQTAGTWVYYTPSSSDATKLPLAGGTMSGAIAMGTSKITGMGDPTAAQDAATKAYVDAADLKLITKNLAQPVAGDDLKVIRWNQTAGNFEYATDSTTDSSKLPLAGGTMTGALTLAADPTAAMEASTKQYADARETAAKTYADGKLVTKALAVPTNTEDQKSIKWDQTAGTWVYYVPSSSDATKLPLAGGTMSGAIAMGTSKITGMGDPTAAQDAATKAYVDAADLKLITKNLAQPVAGDDLKVIRWNQTAGNFEYATDSTTDSSKLPLAGGTMSGAIAMGTSKITGMGDPTAAQDASTKAYVDARETATKTYADTVSGTAETNAKTYADGKLVTKALAVPTNTEDQKSIKWDQTAGTWVYYVPSSSDATKLPLAGGTMSGAIAMGTSKITGMGDPTAAQDAATKAYVDAADLKLITKNLAQPVAGDDLKVIRWNQTAGNFEYATDSTTDSSKLPLAGGTMSGAIAMGTSKITGMGDPTAAQDAATKAYVDARETATKTYADTVSGTAESNAKTYADGKLVAKALAVPTNTEDQKSVKWDQTAGTWVYYTPSTGNAVTSGKLDQFAATTSAELASVISDETGTGLLVYGTAPTIKSFVLGGATSGGITMQVAATGAAGTYTWPSATPASNMILQSDNAGNLTWVAPASGSDASKLPLAGGTMSGAIAMGTSKITGMGDPTAAQDAATKNYVDAADLKLITKNLAQPVAGDDLKVIRWNQTAGNFEYAVDNSTDLSKLPLAGGTMSGAIAMGTSKITGMGDPTAAQDASTKAYTDANLRGQALGTPVGQAGKSIRWNAGDTAWEYYTPATGTGDLLANGSVALSANWDLNGATAGGTRLLTGLADPVVADGAATKNYVDQLVPSSATSAAIGKVRVVTTQNIALTGLQTIDGVAVAAGNRVLVRKQTDGTQNGIYVVAAGAWTRATDFDSWNETVGYQAYPLEGSTFAGTVFKTSLSPTGTVGTDGIYFYNEGASDPLGNISWGLGGFNTYSSAPTGGGNISVGVDAMAYNEAGSNNVAVGLQALNNNTDGNNNVAVGLSALAINTTGSNNLALGSGAGSSVTTGSNNVILGSNDGSTIATASNNILISDGSGNLRMKIDNTGKSDFKGSIVMSGSASGASGFKVPAAAGSTIYELPAGAPGTNGYLLSSNTSGVLTWVAPATGSDATKLPLAGGTMSGAIAMGSNAITGLAAPSAGGDAVNKTYADGKLLGLTLAAPAAGQVGQSIRWNAGNTAWEYFTAGDLKADGTVALSANWDVDGAGAGTRLITGLAVPASADGAATKGYVDSEVSTAGGAFVKKDGSVALTADWDIDGAGAGVRKLTGLAVPTDADGAVTKAYADGKLLGQTLAAPAAGQVNQSIRWNAGNTAWEYYTPASASLFSLDSADGSPTQALYMTNDGHASIGATSVFAFNGTSSTMTNAPAVKNGTGELSLGKCTDATCSGFTAYLSASNTVINAWSNLRIPNGTVGAPGLNFNGSNTTGIFRPAADVIGFSVAGAERMRIDSSGQILEGVSSLRAVAAPTATANYGKVYVDSGDSNKLKYMDPAGAIVNLSSAGTATIADDTLDFAKFIDAMTLDATSTITAPSGQAYSLIVNNEGTADSFRVNDANADASPFVIDATGKVAVGTATPTASYSMTVHQPVASDNGLAVSLSSSTGTFIKANNVQNSHVVLDTTGISLLSGGSLLRYESSGDPMSGISAKLLNIAPIRNANAARNDTDTGNFLHLARDSRVNNAAGSLAVTGDIAYLVDKGTQTSGTLTNSSSVLRLDQQYAAATGTVLKLTNSGTGHAATFVGGNVGIGTATPNALLTVEGVTSLRAVAAPSLTANYGKIYVDSGDSNKLKYMDPAGAIVNLSAAGAGGATNIDGLTDGVVTATSLYLGDSAAVAGATDTNNTAVGTQALDAINNSGATDNTAMGYRALSAITTGDYNTAIGQQTGFALTTEMNNTILGSYAMNQKTGMNNTAVGSNALRNSGTATSTTAVGLQAGQNGSHTYSVLIGSNAGTTSNAGVNDDNVIIGDATGSLLNDADKNVIIGKASGSTLTTGDQNILIGYDIETPLATTSNHLNIGNTIYGDVSAGNVAIGTASANEKLTVEGVTSLRAVAAPSLTANYGKIYVDSGDSNKLKYMNPAGAVTDLTAAGGGSGDFLRNGTLAMTGTFQGLGGVFTSNSSAALSVGPNGATTPTFQVDGSGAGLTAGIKVSGAAGTSSTIEATSGLANATLNLQGKGSGGVYIDGNGASMSVSQTSIALNSPTYASALFDLVGNSTNAYSAAGATEFPNQTSNTGIIRVQNDEAADNTGAFFVSTAVAGDGTGQHGYFGTVSKTGGWAPALVFGQRDAASNYVERMRISHNGALMVGKSSGLASATLDVQNSIAISGSAAGAIKFSAPATVTSGNYTWPSATPASSMVLQSDNTGQLSWVAAGGSVADDSLDFAKFIDSMTLDAVTTITAPSGQAYALNITNDGTGDSFRVNDVASDTSPFVIDADGDVGIGNTAPGFKMVIDTSDAENKILIRNKTSTADRYPGLLIENYLGAATNGYPSVQFRNYGGNNSTTTITPVNTVLGGLAYKAYSGTTDELVAELNVISGPNFASGDLESAFQFKTRDGAAASAERMRINADGKVGIGTNASALNGLLDVKGVFALSGTTNGSVKFQAPVSGGSGTYTWPAATPASNMVLQSDNTGALTWVAGGGGGLSGLTAGRVPYATSATAIADSANFTFNSGTSTLTVTGDINYTGVLTDTSDRRLKRDIAAIEPALPKIRKMKMYSYLMRNDPTNRREFGVMAQDMMEIIPELVTPIDDTYFGVNYIGLTAWTLQAIQELDSENAKLREENRKLSEQLQALKSQQEVQARQIQSIMEKMGAK